MVPVLITLCFAARDTTPEEAGAVAARSRVTFLSDLVGVAVRAAVVRAERDCIWEEGIVVLVAVLVAFDVAAA